MDQQRLAPLCDQGFCCALHGLLIQGNDDIAINIHTFWHFHPQIARDQGREAAGQAIGAGSCAPSQFQNIPEPCGCDQPGLSQFPLQQGIGRCRRAVHQTVQGSNIHLGLIQGTQDAL